MQLVIGQAGDVSLWCEDRGFDENGGQKFWVLNGHWSGVYTRGQVLVEYTKKIMPAKLLWRGYTPFEYDDYNEAMSWLRQLLKKKPHLQPFFEKVNYMKKMTFSDAVETRKVEDHNSRVEALAAAYTNHLVRIAELERKLVKFKEYSVALETAGASVETLSDADYSALYNQQFSL